MLDRHGRLPGKAAVNAKDGPKVFALAEDNLTLVLGSLAGKGFTRILVEAGTILSTAFLQEGFVDRLYWFRAPMVIGDTGKAAFGEGFSTVLSQVARWHHCSHMIFDNDMLDIFECSQAS